jgi:glycosyltransferase involved in cell wall biosynthesis
MTGDFHSMGTPDFDPLHPANSVSVIIPAYNAAKFIAETLHSILNQTVRPFEVIVVNDGSTDNTVSVVEQFGNSVSVITIPNSGVPTARNTGASQANGNWLAFCDSDDLWLPTKLEKQLRLANEAPDIQYIITDFSEMTDGVVTNRSYFSWMPADFWTPELHKNGLVIRESITGKLTTFQPAGASAPIVKRGFFKEVGGFDPEARAWAEDTCFHFRCLSVVPFGVVPEVLMHYRQHTHSMSSNKLKQRNDTITVWNYIIDNYPQAQPYRAELLNGVAAMRREIAETERYLRRQKLKRLLGFK